MCFSRFCRCFLRPRLLRAKVRAVSSCFFFFGRALSFCFSFYSFIVNAFNLQPNIINLLHFCYENGIRKLPSNKHKCIHPSSGQRKRSVLLIMMNVRQHNAYVAGIIACMKVCVCAFVCLHISAFHRLSRPPDIA